ncbi:alpha/beta hydrolase [Actinomadura kijaniata]|uniref:alpha/beta hydrolase n=1 Tax=Actinomadura kijaniata TaxID=46161 RepID=UPI0008359074|nr:alpha/beta hydrolase [Actinomadura kijaniata]
MSSKRITLVAAAGVAVCGVGAVSFAAVSEAAGVNRKVYAYGSHARQKLDVFWKAPRKGTQPGLVIVHGGYWDGGSRVDWRSTAKWYAGQGFAVFSIDHRLVTDAPWPAQRNDAVAAMNWIRKHARAFKLDAGRIAVLGSQAGGQIAAQLGTYGTGGSRVRGVVALSPVNSPRLAYDSAQTTAASWTRRKVRDQTVLLANCTPTYRDATCGNRYTDADPTAHAGAGDAPMWLVHSKGDVIPSTHSAPLRAALIKAGQKDVKLTTVSGGASGGGILTSAARTNILNWLRAHTKPRAGGSSTTEVEAPSALRSVKPRAASIDNGAGAASSRVRARSAGEVQQRSDLAYGTHARQKLDAFWRPSAAPRPAVIAVHGGWWYEGDKYGMAGRARWLADNGYAVFAINYRLNTQAPWSAQRSDVQAAVAWVKSRAAAYNVDPRRVVLLGSSAGGHLVSSVGVHGTGAVKAVAAVSPVANPYQAYLDGQAPGAGDNRRKLRDTAVLLTRCTPVKSDRSCWNRWVDAVAFNHASAGDAPMLMIHSQGDFVPASHGSGLCGKLTPHHVPCTTRIVEGDSHGLSVLNTPGTADLLLHWLKTHA